ncbi:MAG: cytochrome P450 [Acidobacteria bacterium]|nr:cytochrome P450 [Acidobacteriota bacterium]MCA1620721.1 cytochrome P450 [Acidobacteriota bacterium]
MVAATATPAVPGPKGLWPVGQMYAFSRDPLTLLKGLARDYGDVARFKAGPQSVYLLSHPDYVRDLLVTNNARFKKGRALQRAKRLLGEGLLTSEGEFHRRQRRLAQPAFHRQRVAAYGRVMVEYAERVSARWRDGAEVDISEEMMRLTLAVVGKTLFDAEVESDADEVGASLTEVMNLFGYLMLPFSELLEKLPLPPQRRFLRARARLDAVIYRIIEERRREGRDRGDLLSTLLDAVDEEGDRTGMTNEQLRDEVMTIFLAGHETTANALTWAWYLLAQNPEAEARLHEELDGVLDGGRAPEPEDVPALRYTEMVVAETMRLYPPAWALGRLALEDHEVGGYLIPRGSLVLVSQYVIQRDPRFWPDPERFDPERWTPEAKAARPQFAYFPFGGGPRRCVGEGFAWTEAVLILATLARRWRARLVPGRAVELQPRITLRPGPGGVPVRIESREP